VKRNKTVKMVDKLLNGVYENSEDMMNHAFATITDLETTIEDLNKDREALLLVVQDEWKNKGYIPTTKLTKKQEKRVMKILELLS
jgi:hypothetical protein